MKRFFVTSLLACILAVSGVAQVPSVSWTLRYSTPATTAPNSPPWVWWFNGVYDPVTHQTVFAVAPWGYTGIYSTHYYWWNSNTHAFSDVGGTASTGDACPSSYTYPRDRHPDSHITVDYNHNRMWLWTGINVNCADNPLQDMYYMNLTSSVASNSWVRVTPAHFPLNSGIGFTVYDSDHDALIDYGGDIGGFPHLWVYCSTQDNAGVLTSAQGQVCGTTKDDWKQITVTGAPTDGASYIVSHLTAVYDTVTHKVIMQGGGNSSLTGWVNTTWALDPTTGTWSQLCSSPCSPPPAYNGSAGDIGATTYNRSDHMVYFYQGVNTGAPAFWQYNPSTDRWAQMTSSGFTAANNEKEGVLVADEANSKLILWTKNVNSGAAELWEGQLSTPRTTPMMIQGTGAPISSVGIDGDLYYRTDAPYQSIYGPKASGAWPATLSYAIGQGCTTAYHIDKDCDGYGIGPTVYITDPNPVFAQDADDNDATVTDSASVITKYGTINSFLTHLGYPTNRVYYIDPTNGNDSNFTSGNGWCQTAAKPCQTWMAVALTLYGDGAGGTALWRSSTSAGMSISSGGGCPWASSSSAPTVLMAYPGEIVTFKDPYAQPIGGCGTSYSPSKNVVYDGFRLLAYADYLGTIQDGWTENVTYKNMEFAGFNDGLQPVGGSKDDLVTGNLFHDINHHAVYTVTGNGTAGDVYSTGLIDCAAWTWRTYPNMNPHFNFRVSGNLVLFTGAVGYDAIHYNGSVCGGSIDKNFFLSGGGPGVGLMSGPQNITIANNVFANNSTKSIILNNYGCDYNHNPSPDTPNNYCNETLWLHGNVYNPAQINNISIVNNTIWTGLNKPNGTFICESCDIPGAGMQVFDGTEGTPGLRWIKNLTVANNIIVTFNGNPLGGVLRHLEYGPNTYPDDYVHKNNLFYNSYTGNSAANVLNISSNSGSCASQPWYCAGSTTGTWGSKSAYPGEYSFTLFQSYNVAKNSGNAWGDPKFVNPDVNAQIQPNKFNFRLLANSPALAAGTSTGAPATDITGVSRSSTPTIGAYEQEGSPSGDTTPPSVALTAPSAGTVSGTIAVSATCTDDSGSCAGVTFRRDGVTIGSEDTSSPFSISWDTTGVSNGSYSLTAYARDASGNTATSTGVSVTVSNAVLSGAKGKGIKGRGIKLR